MAIASTVPPHFNKKTPPKYPEMPFDDEEENISANRAQLYRDMRREQLRQFLEQNKR